MLTIQRSHDNVKFEGELTIYHATEARTQLAQEMSAGVILQADLSGIEELDTAGVQLLLWLKREGQALGTTIAFTHHSPAVLEVFDQLNLARTFGDTLLISPSS